MLDPLAPSVPRVPRASVSYGSSLNVVTVLLKRNPAAFLENVCLFGGREMAFQLLWQEVMYNLKSLFLTAID